MRSIFALLLFGAAPLSAQTQLPTIPAPKDVAYHGVMTLAVDATDVGRGIFKVRQTIPVAQAGSKILLFPQWLPGNHAPRGQIEKMAGLVLTAGGQQLTWKRDPYDVYAFHVDVPDRAREVVAEFQFLSATEADQGRVVATDAMLNLQWQSVSLYPAGWKTSRIPVSAQLTLPQGWTAATALRPAAGARTSPGSTIYQTVDYETLVDSPVFAGRHFRAEPLGQNVTLNIVADAPKYLAAKPEQINAHRRLVEQAVKLFGARSFDHYDFLLALSDKLGSIGLEHHRSSENGVAPDYFIEWDAGPGRRNLLPHELTHSWVGKRRRPAGQMVGDFRTPLDDSLLWVYEGQTQFWGYVLGARSGLFSKQDTLDALAMIAATLDIRRARGWRSLDDTTFDPIIAARKPKGWLSWQRSEDYYNEGMLIWLEVDAMLRARSRGTKGMDDFARLFFGPDDGDWSVRPFDMAEVVQVLNSLVPFDWNGFLTIRLTEKAGSAPLGGLTQGGYRLVYGDTPTPFFRDQERRAKELNLSFSLGGTIAKAKLEGVIWDGPLFDAGLRVGDELIAVNGLAYSDEAMRDAIIAAKGGKDPLRLIVKSGDIVREVPVMWTGGLRYPKLEKVAGAGDASLDKLLLPRP